MPSPELVSALVPAYNHAPYVRAALAALADQTHRPLELIVGDDASTDGTADRIREFLDERGGEFDRVVFVEATENRGVAEMLNALLARSTGKYVFVNASDDRAAPEAIEVLKRVLDGDRRAALAVGDSIIIDESGRRIHWGPQRQVVLDPDRAAFRTWVEFLRSRNRPGVFEPRLFGRPGTLHRVNYIPNGKLLRRSSVEDVGGWHSGVLEDWDLAFRLSLRHRLRYVDETLYAYRWHATNTVRDGERMRRLTADTKAAIDRRLRNPVTWARVLLDRDLIAGARVRLRRARAGSSS